jgi:hypothetical protein
MNAATAASFSATTLSGGTIYSGGTNLQNTFNTLNSQIESKLSISGQTVTGATNIGSGNALYKQTTAGNLEFRSLSAGTGMVITTGDTVTFNVSAMTRSISFHSSDFVINTATKVILTPPIYEAVRFAGTGAVDDSGLTFSIPEDYLSGNTLYFTWRSIATGTTTARMFFELYTGDTSNTGSLTTVVETLQITDAPDGVNTFLFSSGGSFSYQFQKGQIAHMRVYRDPSNVGDTYTGDLDLLTLVFKYTAIR